MSVTAQSQAQAILWRMGDLSFLLRPEQLAIRKVLKESTSRLFVANCSRRLGKSYMMVAYCIEEALKAPKSQIRYGTAFLTDLTEFIIPAFNKILETCPEHLKPRYLESKKKYIFRNGSEIKLVGLDKNPNSLRGNALTTIVLDEAGFVRNLKQLYVNVIVPATMEQQHVRIIVISTPPESPEHYFVELINKAKLENAYCEFDITHKSNLSEEDFNFYMEEAGGQFSTTAQREYFCKIIIETERAAVPDFQDSAHVIEFSTPEHGIWLVAGDTGGVRDKTVLLLMTYDYLRNKILVDDERWFNSNTPTSVWIPDALAMEDGRRCTRVVDAHGQTQIDLAYENYSSSLPRKDDFHAGLTLLRNVFHKNEIEIHPRCKFLIQSLSGGMLTKNRNDFERTDALGHLDAIAALIYGVRHVDRTTNPIPNPSVQNVYNPNNIQNHLARNLRALTAKI